MDPLAMANAEGQPTTAPARDDSKSEPDTQGVPDAALNTSGEAPPTKRVVFSGSTLAKNKSSASLASKVAKPTAPVGMFQKKHVFVELHEFNQDHWQQTRRWNHGLQESLHPDLAPKPPPKYIESDADGRYDLRRDISTITNTTQISHLLPGAAPWTKPRLPSVSLLGLFSFRDALDSGLILLDVTSDEARDNPCKFVANKMLEHLRVKGHVTPETEQLAQISFVHKLSSISETAMVACAHSVYEEKHSPVKGFAKVSPVKGFAKATRSDSKVEPVKGFMKDPRTDGNGEDDSFKVQNLQKVDPLKPNAEEEIVHVLVDSAAWLERDAVCLARFSSDVCVGLEEDQGEALQVNSRFLMMCLAGTKNEGQAPWLKSARTDKIPRHVQLGEAAATMFQDERVVQAAYGAGRPQEFLEALDTVLRDLKIVPRAKLPDEEAILRRAKQMLDQMTRLASFRYNQNERWALEQRQAFGEGCSVSALLAFMQTFAVPLLSGIALALFLANSYPAFYDRWAGVGPGLDDAEGHRQLGAGGVKDTRPNIFGFEVHGHPMTLHFLVNDILMCLFFGLAGKEITEALQPGGSLYPPTRTTINVLAGTAGGVVGPIVVYLLLVTIAYSIGLLDNSVSLEEYTIGWGVPTATDISLAWVTAICVFGAGHPAINYLLLLAIIDDGIGLLIIAFAYPDKNNPMKPQYLSLVLAAVLLSYVLRRLKCARWQLYVLLAGPLSWFGLLYTGLHPALALVFVVPFIPLHVENDILTMSSSRAGGDHGGVAVASGHGCRRRHPLHEYEESIKNFIDFGVLFLFGAVNAGVSIDGAGWLTVIVLLSLVVGKTLGIFLTSWAATCCACPPPAGMTKATVASVGFIASAGLTVALFVSGEAFSEAPELATQSKMGALLSAAVAFIAIGFSVVQGRIHKSKNKIEAEAREKEKELGTISAETVGSLRRASADTALEDMVVNNAVKSLNFIHDATDAIECRTGIPRWKTLEMLKASMALQDMDEEV